jgi:uncharacterized protein with FMN-binding domain
MGGAVVVKVKMNGTAIEAVTVLEQNETPDRWTPVAAQIPAAIVAANSADIADVVSGSTVSSKAVKEAVKNALSKI